MREHLLTAPGVYLSFGWSPNPSTIRAQRCLPLMIKWVLVCTTWQYAVLLICVFNLLCALHILSINAVVCSVQNSDIKGTPECFKRRGTIFSPSYCRKIVISQTCIYLFVREVRNGYSNASCCCCFRSFSSCPASICTTTSSSWSSLRKTKRGRESEREKERETERERERERNRQVTFLLAAAAMQQQQPAATIRLRSNCAGGHENGFSDLNIPSDYCVFVFLFLIYYYKFPRVASIKSICAYKHDLHCVIYIYKVVVSVTQKECVRS
jgi:hypothetical protein